MVKISALSNIDDLFPYVNGLIVSLAFLCSEHTEGHYHQGHNPAARISWCRDKFLKSPPLRACQWSWHREGTRSCCLVNEWGRRWDNWHGNTLKWLNDFEIPLFLPLFVSSFQYTLKRLQNLKWMSTSNKGSHTLQYVRGTLDLINSEDDSF